MSLERRLCSLPSETVSSSSSHLHEGENMSQFMVRQNFFNNGCRLCQNRYLDPEEEPTPEEEAEGKKKLRRITSKPTVIHVKNWRQCLSCQTENPRESKFYFSFPFQRKIPLLERKEDLRAKFSHVKILEAFAQAELHNLAKASEIRTGLTDGGFQDGIRRLMQQGLVHHLRRGYYELTEKGRSKLNVQAC